ncbi:3',5'-cyclic-AMP phosphodiesterase [Stutzerimonas kirkiae]|uniref:3',5'-cyclic-AMP phosphodiesterase n=1 Tax=Stutzerimonas kirkiae TaxID=2211392 RepID=A0A4V2KBR3_9GAMM|nr:3',5'-cyclic-AMP phosphodiesterase [Stutzerimonas kirkiae]TBU88192.1 3',5'-cyclic-AMP phosphodiesterase [Stutzerimonas kirkiae]TBU98710.1 3',5'-cyclic-AMP phosphodiesterase [Stutzerimonas kirkiae]
MSVAPEEDALLLVQLTDSHLFGERDGRLLGLPTLDSLREVVGLVLAQQPRVDLLLATGDLSQDGSAQSYRYLREQHARIAAPARWCAGNHDVGEVMRGAASADMLQGVTDLGGWRIILLDSAVPGSVSGHLPDERLAWLDRVLREAGERHCLVALHHHPVAMGSQWLDGIGLHNGDALMALLERHEQVRVLLWGHVHQAFDQVRNGTRLLASPSTGVQFTPHSEDFQVSPQAPGYRWLRLHADGRVETAVSRLAEGAFPVDLQGGDY